jgi:PAS domain S-box-containing protein
VEPASGQESVKLERAALEHTLDALPLPVWLASADGTLEFLNRALLQIAGRSAEDLLYDGWQVLMHPDDLHACRTAWIKALETGSTYAIEYRVRVADGSYRWFMTHAQPEYQDGRIIRWLGTCTDIEDRRRAEQSLIDSEYRLRTMLEYLPVGVWLIDQYGRITYGNRAGQAIWGGARYVDVSKMDVYKAWHAETSRRVDAEDFAAARAIRDGKTTLGEVLEIESFDGQRKIILNSAVPIRNDRGEVVGVVVVNEDITQRKRTEDESRRSAEQLRAIMATLEQRVAERTAAVGQQAAQLRALANQLTQAEQRERRRLAHMLHDHLQQLLVAARLRLAGVREHASRREQRLAMRRVDELLDQSIEAARTLTVELSPPILHEAGLCAALHWLVRWMNEKHGLVVHLDAPEPVEPSDQDVRSFLFQAVRELLFNIVKHARVGDATIRVRDHDGQLAVIVEDQGAGFDVHEIESRAGAGGGFGLFSIRERLEGIGGHMLIESRPGEGTRTTLTAPLVVHVEPAILETPPDAGISLAITSDHSDYASPGAANGAIRVLLADDHKILREGLAGVLRHQPDIELIAEAEDGAEAVELTMALRPDVVVMDITMPRLNGIEATRRLKAQCPEVYVIGLSMHEDEEIAEQMRSAGAYRYMTKGGPSGLLIEAIRACRKC